MKPIKNLAAWWAALLERMARSLGGGPVTRFRGPTQAKRHRTPHHRYHGDVAAGIPHGQPGAKLIRKAKAQQLTKCHL